MTVTIRSFQDRATASDALADVVARDLAAATRMRGRASLVVPGGTTPGPFFDALARADLDWPAVTVVPSDERCVPADSERSNAVLIRSRLLRGRAGAAAFVALYEPGGDDPLSQSSAVAACRPVDVCVLGMGDDGHIASLFPDADTLAEALADTAPSLVALRPASAPEPRISLSAPVIREARRLYVLIFGTAKRQILDAAESEGPETTLPVRVALRRAGETIIVAAD